MTRQRKHIQAAQGQGQGRGFIDEHESPTLSSGFEDTDIQISPPHESAEGHPSHESYNPIHSVTGLDLQGAAPTASCKCI
jgi:hypothetical protein